ncbi:AraC family transcriptional regulator [Clostridium sp. E02]|uniref:AraC family transcriptional regulator n=1 Tax=Clostridium sp. E02 TaxID=2487134 RepID=UPI000F52E2A6|nr:AraC family transcriptional regulator [Clostridium sp. E02]
MKPYIFEAIEHGKKYPAKAFVTSIEHSSFHWHYEYEIILVLKGSILVNASPKPTTLEAGDIILLNSKAIHELQRTQAENLCLFIQIGQSLIRDFSDGNKTYYFHLNSQSVDLFPKQNYCEFVSLAAKIGLEFQKNDIAGYYRTKSLLFAFIADLFEFVPYEIHQKAAATKEKENQVLLMQIIEFIQENFNQETKLNQLYKALGIGEKTVYRFLKCNVGLTTKELIDNCRIEASKPLLKFSEKPICCIAGECGFGSENTFYRVFKKEVGVTPNEYRQNGTMLDKNPEVKGYLSFSQKEAVNLLNKHIERRNTHEV